MRQVSGSRYQVACIRYLAVLIVFCLLLVSQAQAAGLAVSPEKLEVVVRGKIGTGVFEVVNISEQTMNYYIAADEAKDQFSFLPSQFSLLPKDSRQVEVMVKPKKMGRLVTLISILAQTTSTSTAPTTAGIKLPITVVNAGVATLPLWFFISLFGGLIILLGIFCWWVWQKHQQRKWWRRAWGKVNLLHHSKKFFK